jgi:hypothetical protein
LAQVQALVLRQEVVDVDHQLQPISAATATLQASQGRLDAVGATWRLLQRRLAELDVDVDDATVRLYHALISPGIGSPKGPARGPPGSRARSNSSSRHSTAGLLSILPTSSCWLEPARSSGTAFSSNDPTNQRAVTLAPHDTLIHRP